MPLPRTPLQEVSFTSDPLVSTAAFSGLLAEHRATTQEVIDGEETEKFSAPSGVAGALAAFGANGDGLRRSNPYGSAGSLVRAAAQHRRAYDDSTVFVEPWANLDGWTFGVAGQVSGAKFYTSAGSAGSINAGGSHSFALGVGDTLRLKFELNLVGAGDGLVGVGFNSATAGAAPASAGTNMFLLGFNSADAGYWNGGSGWTYLGGAQAAGTYYGCIAIDAIWISLSITTAAGVVVMATRLARSGWATINNLHVWNSDTRQLSGSSIGKLGGRKSSATINPRAGVEDMAHSTVLATVGGIAARIVIPKGYDSRVPAPFVIYTHGAGEQENEAFTDANEKTITNALLNAGYIVASAAASPQGWGNTASQDVYVSLYNYVRDTWAISHVLMVGQSMGGLVSLNLIASNRIPVAGWYGIYPVTNLAAIYAAGDFTSYIETAYDFSGSGEYAAATEGFDPCLRRGSEFGGMRMRMTASASDALVPRGDHADVFETVVEPFAREVEVVTHTGDHGDASAFLPSDVLTFFERVIA